MASGDISPFTISVSEDVLADLKVRLNLTRYPENVKLGATEEWRYGTPTHRVKDLVEHWKGPFDWRKIEADINAKLPQFTAPIDAEEPHGILKLHFVHKRSPNANATPLIFSHGWPGNFLEVAKIIEPLTNPTDPKDPSFHVVAPSLPGYVFSEGSRYPGLGIKRTALMFDKLMKKLGYDHYIAQGGDWGGLVIKALAVYHKGSCRATHTNFPVIPPPTFLRNPIRMSRAVLGYMGLPGGYSKREIQFLKETQFNVKTQTAYSKLQSTVPHTLAYGLTDSPVALLGWIYEKLHLWTDAYPWTPDEILTWVMLYWISEAGPGGSVRYYKEAGLAHGSEPNKGEVEYIVDAYSTVPLGVSVFPREAYKFPDEWPNMVQPVKFHKVHDVGGHFAAHEKPELLTEDIRSFAKIILQSDRTLLPN